MEKMISKEKVAERLGIKEQMVMKHAKKLKIRSGRMPVRTKNRGIQYKACFTPEQFDQIQERHQETGLKAR